MVCGFVGDWVGVSDSLESHDCLNCCRGTYYVGPDLENIELCINVLMYYTWGLCRVVEASTVTAVVSLLLPRLITNINLISTSFSHLQTHL